MGRDPLCVSPEHHWNFLHSRRQGAHLTPEVIRSQFYENYCKVAEEYGKESMRRCDEYVDTTLILVSPADYPGVCVLTRSTGWSILRRHFGPRHQSPLSTLAGPGRRARRSPPCPHPQDRYYHFRQRCSYDPTVARFSAHDHLDSRRDVRWSRRFPFLHIPRNAR